MTPPTEPTGLASEGFIGHKPLPDGKCEHRWRNRTTHIVTCRYADGWHAGQVAALSPGPEPGTRLDREALQKVALGLDVLHSTHFDWGCNAQNCSGQEAIEIIAAEYDRVSPALSEASEPDGTRTVCAAEGVHEHAFRGPHVFHEWEPGTQPKADDPSGPPPDPTDAIDRWRRWNNER